MKWIIPAVFLLGAVPAYAQSDRDRPLPDKDVKPLADKDAKPQPAAIFKPIQNKADWDAVTAAQKDGEIRSLEEMQKLAAAKPGNDKLHTEIVSRAATTDTPVLLPVSFGLAERFQFVAQDSTYSYTGELPNGEFYVVSGTCKGARLPEGHPILKQMRARQPDYPCLLYTSPSPRDQRGSRMPSSA